jgi:hypothetical protein
MLDVDDGAEQPVAHHLGGLPGVVRGEHHVGQGEDGIVGGQRLLVEDVQAGAEDLPVAEGGGQRVALHEGAASGVDEDRAGLHEGQLAAADEATRLVGETDMEAHHVGLAQDVVLAGGLGAGGADASLVAARAPREHVHADGAAEHGDAAADGAHPEHPERLAEELGEHLARPLPTPHLAVDGGDLAPDREHEGEGVLGHREGVDAGRVADRDSTHARGVEVDVVGAGAPHRDHLEPRTRGEDPVAEARVGPDVDGDARVADAPDELGLVVGAALGEHAEIPQGLRALLGRRPLEDGREVVGDDDHAVRAEKTA